MHGPLGIFMVVPKCEREAPKDGARVDRVIFDN